MGGGLGKWVPVQIESRPFSKGLPPGEYEHIFSGNSFNHENGKIVFQRSAARTFRETENRNYRNTEPKEIFSVFIALESPNPEQCCTSSNRTGPISHSPSVRVNFPRAQLIISQRNRPEPVLVFRFYVRFTSDTIDWEESGWSLIRTRKTGLVKVYGTGKVRIHRGNGRTTEVPDYAVLENNAGSVWMCTQADPEP